jgi:hypothetical protein
VWARQRSRLARLIKLSISHGMSSRPKDQKQGLPFCECQALTQASTLSASIVSEASSVRRCVSSMSSCGRPASKRRWISLKYRIRQPRVLPRESVPPDDKIISFSTGSTDEYQSRQVPIRSNISALMGAADRGLSWCCSGILNSLLAYFW